MKHTDWCPGPDDHAGDCWEADARAKGRVPGDEPILVIVELDENSAEIRREEIR